MAFTTFVYDTLDVCTRLGRYILQELTGLQGTFGRWFATALTAGAPLFFLLGHPSDAPVPSRIVRIASPEPMEPEAYRLRPGPVPWRSRSASTRHPCKPAASARA